MRYILKSTKGHYYRLIGKLIISTSDYIDATPVTKKAAEDIKKLLAGHNIKIIPVKTAYVLWRRIENRIWYVRELHADKHGTHTLTTDIIDDRILRYKSKKIAEVLAKTFRCHSKEVAL